MKPKFLCSLVAVAALISAPALAQTSSPSAALPSAPGAAADPPNVANATGGSKVAVINIEQAILATNEGQRDFETLNKKLEPKQNQLKSQNDEIEALKKKADATGTPETEKADLQRQVEAKQKTLQRDAQDAQEDARNQENEIAQRILQKMAPVIIKYGNDNGFGIIIDTSPNNQWPNGPILWHGGSVDITKQVVDLYNVQSGVAAKPAGAAGSKPLTTKPSATTTKPAGSGASGTTPTK